MKRFRTASGRSISPKRPFFNVACGIVIRRRRILVAERDAKSYYGGYWEFPGGKIERGETPEEGLRRELKEELGIGVKNVRAWRAFDHRYPERHVKLHFFVCHFERGRPQPIGCASLKWVHPNDLIKLRFLPANEPILSELNHIFSEGY